MPSYCLATNELVIDTVDQAGTQTFQDTFGAPPSVKHTAAHDEWSKTYISTMASQFDDPGAMQTAYSEIVSRGGYFYVDSIDYDFDDYLVTVTTKTYFPTRSIYDSYKAWVESQGMYGKGGDITDDELDFEDAANHSGRGRATITVQDVVDFNKPYRT